MIDKMFKFEPPSHECIAKTVSALVKSDQWDSKRYTLFSVICEVEDSYEMQQGKVTGYSYLRISSDSRDYLKSYWEKSGIEQKYSTTNWHFIFDNKERKVVTVMSMCI